MASKRFLLFILGIVAAIGVVFIFQFKELSVHVVVTPRNKTLEYLDAMPKHPAPKSVHRKVNDPNAGGQNEIGQPGEAYGQPQDRTKHPTTAGIPKVVVTTPKLDTANARKVLPTAPPTETEKGIRLYNYDRYK
jgi:hypothetical protein